MVDPYYQQDNITLFCGDAREIVPTLPSVDVVITDPVWPNSTPELAGADDPFGLFADVTRHLPAITERVVVQLGCDSDPRILSGIPETLPFFRACWLEYVRPHYKGRVLYTNDVAYVFGKPPKSRPGAHVLPGRMIQHDAAKRFPDHPCPRQLSHVKWLVKWFADGLVLDPFMGSGTTMLACYQMNVPFIGIEIEERFCEAAVSRLSQRVFSFAT